MVHQIMTGMLQDEVVTRTLVPTSLLCVLQTPELRKLFDETATLMHPSTVRLAQQLQQIWQHVGLTFLTWVP